MAGFVDPLDEEADAAEASIVGKRSSELKERLSGAKEDDTSEVIVHEPDEDEDAEEADVAPSRRDKRAARQTTRERAAAAEARAQAYKEALELSGRQAPAQERGARTNPVGEIEGRIRATIDAQEALHDEWVSKQGRMSKEEERRLRDRAIDLDVEKTSLIAERREVLTAPRRENEARLSEIRNAHPDVFANPDAVRYALATWNAKMARKEPDTREAVDASMEEARQVILGKRPKPDAAQKQRASSMSPGVRHSATDEPVKLSMPRGSALYRMAIAQFPNLEPAQACQKWAQKNGKSYREATRGK